MNAFYDGFCSYDLSPAQRYVVEAVADGFNGPWAIRDLLGDNEELYVYPVAGIASRDEAEQIREQLLAGTFADTQSRYDQDGD